MKARRIFALILAVTLILSSGVLNIITYAAEPESVEITLSMLTNTSSQKSITGLYSENVFYVSLDTLKTIVGVETVKEEKSVAQITTNRGAREFTINIDEQIMYEEYAADYKLDIPVCRYNGNIYLSALHFLRYIGATVKIDSTDAIQFKMYYPYNIYDAMHDYSANSEATYFHWYEVEHDDPELMEEVLGGSIILGLLNKDSNFIRFFYDTKGIYQECVEDALISILKNEGQRSDSTNQSTQQLIDEFEWTTHLLNYGNESIEYLSFIIEYAESCFSSEALEVLGDYLDNINNAIGTLGDYYSVMGTIITNTFRAQQFTNLSDSQKSIINDTIISNFDLAMTFLEDDSMKSVYGNATQQTHSRVTNSQANNRATTSSILKALLNDKIGDGVDKITKIPITKIWNLSMDIVKDIPYSSGIMDRQTMVFNAYNCYILENMVSQVFMNACSEMVINNNYCDNIPQQKAQLELIKKSLIFQYKSALTARENLISSNYLLDKNVPIEKQRNEVLVDLLNKLQNCSLVLVGVSPTVSEDLTWMENTNEHVHSYSTSIQDATCTTPGWKKQICSCGDVIASESLKIIAHNYTNGKCSMCGKDDEMVAWSGNIDTSWYSETTMEFLISTPEQLAGLAQLVNEGNNFSGILITLDQSMRLNDTTWVPIGLGTTDFAGIFDGNGHVISGFSLTGSLSYAGLFGKISGTIKNLGVENFSIDVNCAEGTIYTGGLVGYNKGSIINCYANGDINATANGSGFVGGLTGINSYGSIINCYANVDVTSTVTTNSQYITVYVGGLVGDNDGTLMNSYATGDIIASGYSSVSDSGSCYAGGLVGYNENKLANSFATGNVKASSQSGSCHAGGLTGYNSGSITNTYRNEKQQFTVQNNGTVTYESTDTSGSATSIENLQSKEWIGKKLWKNEIEVWNFGVGYPTLKYDIIKTPIEISTKEQLLDFQDRITTLSYLLVSDIDLEGMSWDPIEIFYGIFDGNGHIISNFKVTEYFEYTGLFGENAGIIKNLGLDNFTVTSDDDAGSLVGKNSCIITNCYSNGNVNSESCAGGLVGNNAGLIAYSYALGGVHSESTDSNYAFTTAGGLAGENSGIIISSYASCDVSSSSSAYSRSPGVSCGAGSNAGGLVGENSGKIKNCYANGLVTSSGLCSSSSSSSDSYAGGLVGYNYSKGSIVNAYACGNVSSEARSYYTENYAGGLIGYNKGAIMRVYATGNINATFAGIRSASVEFGGLVGNDEGTITDSYRYSEQSFEIHEANYSTTYSATNKIGNSKTIEELKSDIFHTNALGWSADIWHFVEGQYPTLKNVGTTN